MHIHVFNPEHDIALVSGERKQTVPKVAIALRRDIGFLPVLWARRGDVVLVDDADIAMQAARQMGVADTGVLFLEDKELSDYLGDDDNLRNCCGADVWGWDAAVCDRLLRLCVPEAALPDRKRLAVIRDLSHRRTAVAMLDKIREDSVFAQYKDMMTGESSVAKSEDDVCRQIGEHGKVVLKAPWSSSGRGVRYINGSMTDSQRGWFGNVIRQQGAMIVEPYYEKVCDFGMEYTVCDDGRVVYEGLSLFYTEHGAYVGSMLGSESEKMNSIVRYVPRELIDLLHDCMAERLAAVCRDKYVGALGVDMMIVRANSANGFALHPCVEINFRRTMGHVAIHLASKIGCSDKTMRIVHDTGYKVEIV